MVELPANNTDAATMPREMEPFPTALKTVPDSNLAKFLARPVYVGKVVSDGVGATLTMGSVGVFPTWSTVPSVENKLNGYYGFSGDLVIDVVYTGNPTCIGTTILAFYPSCRPGSSASADNHPLWFFNPTYSDMVSLMELPHLKICLEQSANLSIRLPYPLPIDALEIYPTPRVDWYVTAIELNEMIMNDGTVPVAVTASIYAHYENVELYIPITPHSGNEEVKNPATRASYSSMLMRGANSAVTFVTSFAKAMSGLASVAATMGFSRPLEVVKDAIYTTQVSSLSYVSGMPDFSDKMALDPSQSLDVTGRRIPMANENDTRVDFLTRKWGFLVGDLTIPYGAGTHYSLCIHPTVLGVPKPSGAGYGPVWALTPLAYASTFFKYWRGDLEVKVEFVANSLLRGRYGLVAVPPWSTVPADFPADGSLPSVIVDVSGRTEAFITIPFAHLRPFLPVTNFTEVFTLTSGESVLAIYALDFVQGNTTGTLEANVYVRGAETFNLAVPDLTIANYYQKDANFLTVHSQQPLNNVVTFGENVEDLLQLTRRYVAVARVKSPVVFEGHDLADGTGVGIPLYGLSPLDTDEYGKDDAIRNPLDVRYVNWSFLTYLACGYVGMTGGARHKIFYDGTGRYDATYLTSFVGWTWPQVNNPTVPMGTTSSYFKTNPTSSHGGTVLARNTDFLEIELPSRIPGKFSPAASYGLRPEFSGGYTDNLFLTYLPGYSIAGVAHEFTDYVAAADDFIIRGYLCPPHLRNFAKP